MARKSALDGIDWRFERFVGRGRWFVAGTGVLAERARLAPVGLSPRKMVERNSAFDVSRWIFVGGGWIRLLVVTLARTRAMSRKGHRKSMAGFSPRKVVERECMLNWKDASREMSVVDQRFECSRLAES